MKKLIVFGLLFLSMNGLHATELLPESQGLDAATFSQWCVAHGGESYAELVERFAQRELREVRRVRWLIGTQERGSFMCFIIQDCFFRQDRALRLLWLLQEAGYPSEAQRR